MSSETNSTEELSYCKKIAQLRAAIKDHIEIECLEIILRKVGSIKCETTKFRDVLDGGLLHFAYKHNAHLQVFDLLINNGVDFTVKNNEGYTVIHKIVHLQYNPNDSCLYEFENRLADLILSGHVKFGNGSNPSCKHNISHFHVACLKNNVEAVEFFLKNEVDINQAVSVDSPFFAGFTPLHLAVKCSYLPIVKILLKYGVNLHLRNAAGMSPLHLAMVQVANKEIRKLKGSDDDILFELLAKHVIEDDNVMVDDIFGLSNLHLSCVMKDTSFLEDILSERRLDLNQPIKIESPFYSGYTPLHFAAASNINTVKLLIDKGADIEVKDANGSTPFDLCLQNYGVEDIISIISSQARWKDIILSDNKTRLVDLIYAMNSEEEFGKFLGNFECIADLKIPEDSPLWPGYTILHLAVIFSEKAKDESNHSGHTSKAEECLTRGAEITKSDRNGSTVFHLAFYLQKFSTVELLLQRHLTLENPFDSNNLSYFHIACAAGAESAVERFLTYGNVDVNAAIATTVKWNVLIRSHLGSKRKQLFLTPGSAALHISVACGNVDITRMLLENGADIHAQDVNGFTPVHRLLTSHTTLSAEEIGDALFGTDELRDSISEGGLSHLHVACRLDHYDAVEKLLDSGADVNAAVTYKASGDFLEGDDYFFDPYGHPSNDPSSFLSRYSGFTPLNFAIMGRDVRVQKLLVERGADVLAPAPFGCIPAKTILEDAYQYDEIVLSGMLSDSSSKNRLKDEFGLTPLYVACYTNNFEGVNDLLSRGEDVNARVDDRFPIWSGYTPLHIAAENVSGFRDQAVLTEIFEKLLEEGADITLEDKVGDTPLHVLNKQFDGSVAYCECAYLILGSLKKFDVKIAHSQRMSFFHFACLIKDSSVIEAFVKNGIDVNKPIDYFNDSHSGCSPLHLAAAYGSKLTIDPETRLRIVDLLLKHGADVHAKDVYENTLLHSAAWSDSARHTLFDMFIRAGVNVNAVNLRGETALELLIKSGDANWKEVEHLLKHGSRINFFNSITGKGCLAGVLDPRNDGEQRALDDDLIKHFIDSEYVSEMDVEGRTILHNIVSVSEVEIVDYAELIGRLIKRGLDVNQRDKEGRTALHAATWFRNGRGVLGLMKNNADVNVTDEKGRTAFNYGFEPPRDRNLYDNHSDTNHVINTFAMHVHKMKRCVLHISEVNRRLQVDALEMHYLNEDVLEKFHDDIVKSKTMKIQSSGLTLYDFGFKIDAEMIYPVMPLSERLEIDEFFENMSQYNLHELDYVLKLKHKSAAARLRLINLAVVPFMTVIKNQLPDLCCRVILSFLPSNDLDNVIATEDL